MQAISYEVVALAIELHRKRTLGVAVPWSELDRLLEGICGPMERKKRCEWCDGAGGQVGSGVDKRGHTIQFEQCERCNGDGYVSKGE